MSKAWFRIRQLVTIFLMVSLPILALYPAEAQAMSAGSAFNSLLGNVDTSSTTPGYYQTEARGAFVAGGFNVHFANNNFQLINITPPSFSAGCGGISMFFGGFSFISGAQFSALVQNILQAAIGYAIQLAIQTLCPACEAVLQVLQKAAQMANSLANNTCQMAQDIVNKGASMLGLPGLSGSNTDESQTGNATKKGSSGQCADEVSSSGNGSGFLSSLNSGICQFAASAQAEITKLDTQIGGAGETAQADKQSNEFGNLTYEALRSAGVSSWESIDVLMSLVGTAIVSPPASCVGSTSCSGSTSDYKPLFAAGINKHLRGLVLDYLCGMTNSAALVNEGQSTGDESFCQNLAGTTGTNATPEGAVWQTLQGTKVYYCVGVANSPAVNWPTSGISGMLTGTMGDCTNVQSAPLDLVAINAEGTNEQNTNWSSYSQQGFLVYVSQTLQTAVNDVANNQPLAPSAIQLIQEAPFPLYQVIDLAAVYPTTATQLVDAASQTIALLLAERMLVEVMDNVMDATQISNQNAHTVSLAGAMNVLSSIREQQAAVTQRALTLNSYELQMMSEVRQIQRLIQDQVMQQGIMGNEQYSQALMSGLTLGSGPNS